MLIRSTCGDVIAHGHLKLQEIQHAMKTVESKMPALERDEDTWVTKPANKLFDQFGRPLPNPVTGAPKWTDPKEQALAAETEKKTS